MARTANRQKRRSFISLPLLLVALAALVLRIAVLWWRSGHDPFFRNPINDAAVYLGWARALEAGAPFGVPGAPYHLAPLYPRFLGWILPLGGGSLWAVLIVQALLGSATVLGVGLLARRLAGTDRPAAGRIGWLAAVLAAVCAPTLWYEGWLLPTTLNLFLLALGLNLLAAAGDRDRRYGLLPLAAGLALGLAAVNRPQQLLVIAGAAAWLFLPARREDAGGKALRRWRPVLLLALGALLVIAPATIRNLKVSGEPVLITASGGLNFYLGNRPGADGRFGLADGLTPYIQDQQKNSRELAVQQAGRELDWQGVSRHWLGRALEHFGEDPGAVVPLVLRKLWLSLSWREMENNFVTGWVHAHTGPGRLLVPSLGFLWVLAVPGLILARRRRAPAQGPLWILLGATLLTCLLFWVSTRNRLPLLLPLAGFAAYGLAYAAEAWRRPLPIAAAAVVALLVFWPTGEKREGAAFYVDLGRIHAQSRQPLEARANFELALEIEPGFPMARNGLALTYMDTGEPRRAIAMLEDLLRDHPDFEFARRNLEAIRRATAPPRPRSR